MHHTVLRALAELERVNPDLAQRLLDLLHDHPNLDELYKLITDYLRQLEWAERALQSYCDAHGETHTYAQELLNAQLGRGGWAWGWRRSA